MYSDFAWLHPLNVTSDCMYKLPTQASPSGQVNCFPIIETWRRLSQTWGPARILFTILYSLLDISTARKLAISSVNFTTFKYHFSVKLLGVHAGPLVSDRVQTLVWRTRLASLGYRQTVYMHLLPIIIPRVYYELLIICIIQYCCVAI